MGHKKSGFSLFSTLIYLSAATMIIVFLLKASTSLYPHIVGCGKKATVYVKLYTALDHITRDLYQAPYEQAKWNSIKDNKIGWKLHNTSISWRYKKNKLVRLEGSYDAKTKRWQHKAKSIGADLLSECSFVVRKAEGQLEQVSIKLCSVLNGVPIECERIVTLRTGALL